MGLQLQVEASVPSAPFDQMESCFAYLDGEGSGRIGVRQDRVNGRDNGVDHFVLVQEMHLGLGRMHIDVNFGWIDVQAA